MEIAELIKDFKKLSAKRKSMAIVFILLTLLANIFVVFKVLNFNNDYSLEIKIIIILYSLFVINSLGYLSIFDIYHFAVPDKLTIIIPVIMAVITLSLIFLIGSDTNIVLWQSNVITPMHSLLGGIAGAVAIALIVVLTKGNGMGDGDIRIMAMIGLLVGIHRLLVAFYITIFSALITGLIYAYLIKKFKGVHIPFVPFIALGGILTFIFAIDNGIILNIFRIPF